MGLFPYQLLRDTDVTEDLPDIFFQRWVPTSTCPSCIAKSKAMFCDTFSVFDAGNIANLPRFTEYQDQPVPIKHVVSATRTSKASSSTALPCVVEAVNAQFPKVVLMVSPRLLVVSNNRNQ